MPRLGLATLNHSPLHGLPTAMEAHLDAAAAAGYDAIAPDVFWLRALEAEGTTLEQLVGAMQARGLACMEVAGLALGDEEQTAKELEENLRYAGALSAEFVNVRVVAPIDDALVERLRHCAQALDGVGTRIALEFSGGTSLRGVADSRRFLEEAGIGGVGVTLDTWHFFQAKAGPDWEALEALPLDLLANIQISDGTPLGDREYFEQTMHHRLLAGEGEFELGRCAERLRSKGFDGAIVVEVLSAALRERSLEDFAKATAESTRTWWGVST